MPPKAVCTAEGAAAAAGAGAAATGAEGVGTTAGGGTGTGAGVTGSAGVEVFDIVDVLDDAAGAGFAFATIKTKKSF